VNLLTEVKMSCLALLYLNQLSQTPGEESPIFLLSDNEHDWMLAKMWVKSADFLVHQLVTHLLKTHLMSEVFEIAMHRQLPPVHPVYKVHVSHYTVMTFRFGAKLKTVGSHVNLLMKGYP